MSERRLPLFLLAAVLLGLGLGAQALTRRAWALFVADSTPFAFPPVEPPVRTPAPSRRVVLILVDGLSLAPSLALPSLNALRAKGADYACRVGLPSLSNPGRGVLFSGAWQEIHGQITNFNVRPLPVDTLFRECRRVGLRTGLAGTESTLTLMGDVPDRVILLDGAEPPPDPAILEAKVAREREAALALVDETNLSFGFVELNTTDDAGHLWGGASPEYRTAARNSDEVVGAVADRLDLSQDTLVVTADHGHTPQGGHGGGEPEVLTVPLVLAGAGIRSGVRGAASQAEVASTISALLGIPVPASNQGHFLSGALVSEEHALPALCLEREHFVESYRAVMEIGGAAVPRCRAGSATETLKSLDALEARTKAAWVARERLSRGARALATAFALLAVAHFLRTRGLLEPGAGRAALAGGGGALIYYVFLPRFGLSYSLSVLNKDSALGRYFGTDMAIAAGLCALAASASIRRPEGLSRSARASWIAESVFLLVFLVKIAVVYVAFGIFVGRDVPNTYWGFGFYQDALAVLAVSWATPVMPLFAWLGPRVRRLVIGATT